MEYNEAKAALDTAFFDGKVEGKIEGQIEEKLETAKTMLEKGFDISVITEITKLTTAQIEALR